MPHPMDLPVRELAAAIRDGRIGAKEALDDCLARISHVDGKVNAIVALDPDAGHAAERVDEAVAAGEDLAACAGVPTLIKDLNNVNGLPTTFGATSMSEFVPPFDDDAVAKIRAAGFVIVGKTNSPEIGSLPTTEPALHGPTRNPWDLDRSAGGSSGGAGAAIAAGYVAAAHGSDGGGSLRIPASCCGVVGLKPSRGRVSQGPLFGELILGFATQGPMGRRVVDAAVLLDAMAGYVPGDPVHVPGPPEPLADQAAREPAPAKIGVLESVPWSTPDATVAGVLTTTADALADLGHEVEAISPKLPGDVPDRFLRIWSASVAANPLPRDQLEPHNQRFADDGWDTSAPDLLRDLTALQLATRAFLRDTAGLDAVLAPVLSTPPWPIGAHDADDHEALLEAVTTYIGPCPLANVSGQPAIALPAGTHAGLPIGVQLLGRPGDEAGLIRLGAQLEDRLGWTDRRPPR